MRKTRTAPCDVAEHLKIPDERDPAMPGKAMGTFEPGETT